MGATLLSGCSTPKISFETQTGPTSNFNDPGVTFRIARSQISITPKAGTSRSVFVATVIDPVPTDTATVLPLNEDNGLFYTLDYEPPAATEFTSASFDKLILGGPQKAWPIPTCGTATIRILSRNRNAVLPDLTWAAVPTELDYPAAAGSPAKTNSTLYRATGVDNVFSTTSLKITYIPNTKLVSSVGTTVTDHVVDDITTAATIATAVAGVAALGVVAPTPPVPIVSQTLQVGDNRVLEGMSLPSNGSISLHTVCGADRTDASTGGPSAIITGLGKVATAAESTYAAWAKTKQSAEPPAKH